MRSFTTCTRGCGRGAAFLTCSSLQSTTEPNPGVLPAVPSLVIGKVTVHSLHVGEIVEFRGDQCDWKRRADDDPFRWLLIQAGTYIALPVTPAEQRRGVAA